MKILHIFHHSNLVNGVDRTTLTLLRSLRTIGIEVSALVPDRGDVTQELDKLKVSYRVASLGCCTGPSRPAELRYLSQAATRAEIIECQVREEQIDLIHLNTGHLLDGAIAACKANVPAIWHIHSPFEIDFERYARLMGPEAYAWLLGELGDHVIAVSEDVRNSLLQWLPEEKVSTLYNGIDVDDLDTCAQLVGKPIREELGLAPDIALILGVGRISAQKDFATFVRVAQQVTAEHTDVCFAIAGPVEAHELAQALERQIKALGLSRRVFLLGPRRDIPALLVQSQAFLSTAIFEGHPLTSLEAMALRIPVVAMDCVGLRECINSGIDGLLVPLGDEDACAQAVLRLLHDEGLAKRLGERGRQSVQEKYSAHAYATGFLAIAKNVLNKTGSAEKAIVADFALGLLKGVREANERAARLSQPPHLRSRLKSRLMQWVHHLK
jgi:glycosyltransferase involved in cell wall biosynthesis